MADFAAWCARFDASPLPASGATVAGYLAQLAKNGRKASTIRRRVSAISQAHQAAGLESPTKAPEVREMWARVRHTIGTAEQGKAPVLVDDLRRMVATLPDTPLGLRDRALLLLGFAGAFRRSELVGLDVGDVRETGDGLVVTLRRSKTDQERQGAEKGIPYGSTPATCPVRALRAWLALRSVDGPALFVGFARRGHELGRLSDRAVARIVQRTAEAAGLDPSAYAGHSLSAGLATSTAAADVPERVIARQTGHRSMTVLRRYIRSGSLFRENAAARVGL